MFSPDQPGSEGCPPKICADEVSGEDEGEVCYVRSTMQVNRSNSVGPRFMTELRFRTAIIDLSFPQQREDLSFPPKQREESDHGDIDLIQIGSNGADLIWIYVMSQLLHPAVCDSSVVDCPGTGVNPSFTSRMRPRLSFRRCSCRPRSS